MMREPKKGRKKRIWKYRILGSKDCVVLPEDTVEIAKAWLGEFWEAHLSPALKQTDGAHHSQKWKLPRGVAVDGAFKGHKGGSWGGGQN